MRNARVDLRLPEKQKARWMKEAGRRKLDLSEMIRRYVEDGLGDGAVRDRSYSEVRGRKGKNESKAAG